MPPQTCRSSFSARPAPITTVPKAVNSASLPRPPERGGALLLPAVYESAPRQVRNARNGISQAVLDYRSAELVDATGWLVSVFLTNVIRHSQRTVVRISTRSTLDGLITGVEDNYFIAPLRLPPAPQDERGCGLLLLVLLADHWSISATHRGAKGVWCCLKPVSPVDLSRQPALRRRASHPNEIGAGK
ncbi:hypothetical protein ACFU7T_12460 [Streptomyces sp. NPDC057555]|uniref:hypothetical protein n=1 Tax=Streptomyces sp. NPDC057555 TaxID=3346166 RepID=UPI003675F7DC